MPLYLSGGGYGKQSEDIDRLFSKNIDKTKPVLYIPIAMDTNKHPYPECLEWIKNNFKKYNVKDFVMWTEKELYSAQEKNISDFGGIYIGGGNTFYLSNHMRSSGFWNLLEMAVEKDLNIYGSSAGAAIFSKTIIPAFSADKNDVSLEDFNGMNCIYQYHFWAHYNQAYDQIISEFDKKYKLNKIVGVPEDAALFISNNTITNIGKSPIIFFENRKKHLLKPKNNFL